MNTTKPTMESELVARGIFRSKRGGGHRCRLCASNADFFDPIRHSRDSRHSAIEERFALVFDGLRDVVRCRVCSTDLSWEDLADHARLHRLTPWYAPADRYKILFENGVVERGTRFYCRHCDVFFAEWTGALSHAEDERHAALVPTRPAIEGSTESPSEPVPYKVLVKEDIVAGFDGTFTCTACRRDGLALSEVVGHCRDAQHVKSKMRFSFGTRERKIVDSRADTKTGSEGVSSGFSLSASPPEGKNEAEHSPASFPEEKKAIEASDDIFRESAKSELDVVSSENVSTELDSSAYIYVVEYYDAYHCELCGCALADSESVERHLRGISHSTSLKTHGCERIVFDDSLRDNYCEACDCRVLGAWNVVLHVVGARHTASLSRQRSNEPGKIDDSTEQPEVPFRPAQLPEDYILRMGEYVFCRICNWNVVPNATDDHVTGMRHKRSIEQFHEHITVRDEDYRCGCCDCVVQDLPSLYHHLKSYRHRTTVEKMESVKTAESVESPEEEAPVEESRDRHIVRSQADDFRCKICDRAIAKDSVDAHVAGVQHVLAVQQYQAFVTWLKSDKYKCEACRCTVRGLDNVYLHLHGSKHRSAASGES